MGLLARMTAAAAGNKQKKQGDDILLLHGMMLMAGADGVIEGSEIAILQGFWNTLPEFEGKDFDETLAEANKLVARFGNLKDSVTAIGNIKSPWVRKKLYILCADIAMSSGDVAESEDDLLETMQRLLKVETEDAEKILEVLSIKYTQ